jgi:hypothetical protein
MTVSAFLQHTGNSGKFAVGKDSELVCDVTALLALTGSETLVSSSELAYPFACIRCSREPQALLSKQRLRLSDNLNIVTTISGKSKTATPLPLDS